MAAPRPCIPSRAALPPLAPAPCRPCQRAGAGPVPRRSAARYGNPRRHPPRRTAHPVRCLPAPPAGDVRRRAGGVGELNPGAACPAKDSGGPGARLHPLRPVGRITPWALSADTPEARPGLERHPPVVQLQASRSRSWALEQGVGDFRALLQAAADGGGNRLAGLCGRAPAAPRSACGCRACCAPRRRPGRSAGGCPACSSMRRSRCSRSSRLRRASRAARRCSSWRVRRRMRRSAPGASRRSRSQTQAPGGQGWRRGGEALMATS